MLRKTFLALAATTALGALALTSSAASAHGPGIGAGHGPGHFVGHDFRRHLFGRGYWGGLGYGVAGGDCFYTPRGLLVCPEY
jgi:2,3-bisphosphoglycerate-independent phosphoglycerate mutase